MSLNPKNLLQEHFQAQGLPLPTYDSGRVGGADHNPTWVSQVQLHDGSIFVSPISANKKLAEKLAAKAALESFGEDVPDIRSPDGSSTKWAAKPKHGVRVYIDVENQSRATLDLLKIFKKYGQPPDCYTFHFVMSRGCSLKERLEKELVAFGFSNLRINVTKSLAADAADIYIVMLAAKTMDTQSTIILSNDRFAHTFCQVAPDVYIGPDMPDVFNMISFGELHDFLLV